MPKIDDNIKVDRIFNPEKIVRKNAQKTSVFKSRPPIPYQRTATSTYVGHLNIRKIHKRVTKKFQNFEKKLRKVLDKRKKLWYN